MLKAIHIENFKAFGEPTVIPCAPITLLFGENSAGKSSILHALNLLKQTSESREAAPVLLPRSEGGVVDLGGFQELIHNHDPDRVLHLRLEIDGSASPQAVLGRGYRWESLSLGLAFERPAPDGEIQLTEMSVFLDDEAEPTAVFKPTPWTKELRRSAFLPPYGRLRDMDPPGLVPFASSQISRRTRLWIDLHQRMLQHREAMLESLARIQTSLRRRHPSVQRSLFPDEPDADSSRVAQLSEQVREAKRFYKEPPDLESFVNRMVDYEQGTVVFVRGFLPLTPSRRRPMMPEVDALLDVSAAARNTIDSVWLDSGRFAVGVGRLVQSFLSALFPMGPFRRPPERWYVFTGSSPRDVGYRGDLLPDLLFRHPELVEEANVWLNRLGIGYEMVVRALGPQLRDLFEVRLVDLRRSSRVEVGLPDVGFGISQLLPFLVQALLARGRVISIEQPEVHIHPRLQADLGDLLAETIREPRQNQFLIETHSEHLILRIQKLVRLGKLRPEDVAVIYVSRADAGAQATRLALDSAGEFVEDWPGGFFQERLREL